MQYINWNTFLYTMKISQNLEMGIYYCKKGPYSDC